MSRREERTEIDWPKILMGLALVGLTIYAFNKLSEQKPGTVQPAQPTQPGQLPASPGFPGGGGGLQPDAGDGIKPGDTVVVASRFAEALPPGVYPEHVTMTVLSVGATDFIGAPLLSDGRVIEPISVPRSAIISKTPLPVPVPGGGLVPVTPPSPSPEPKGDPIMLGNPIPLKKGRKYRARLDLSAMEAMMANGEMISGQFATIGFTGINVYAAVATLPLDWPGSTVRGDTSRTFWLEGTWSKEDQNVPKPSQVSMVWEA